MKRLILTSIFISIPCINIPIYQNETIHQIVIGLAVAALYDVYKNPPGKLNRSRKTSNKD